MTVSSTGARASYLCNGTTSRFSYPYPFFSPADLLVLLFDTSTNLLVVPQPVLNGSGTYDYTVNGTQDSATGEYLSGATLAANNAPPAPYKWIILNAISLTQPLSLQNYSKYFAGSVNAEFDRVTLLTQQLLLSASYAIAAPFTDEPPAFTLPPAATRASQILGFDANGNVALVSPSGASVVGNPGVAAFATFAAAGAASPALNNLIYVQGYYAAGDGGDCFWKKIPAVPGHDVYFTAADGSIWEPAVSKFDPRAWGAKADVFAFSEPSISSDNLSELTINDADFPGFTEADLGKNIVVWDYPCAHTIVNTTISGIVSPTTCTLAAAASGATEFAHQDGFYGTDDSAIINEAMTFAAYGTSGFSAGPPPTCFQNGSQFNTLAAGAHTLVFRALDANSSRYGIADEIDLLNSCVLEFEENACLFALGNFSSASTAMISQSASGGYECIAATLVNAKLQGNGFAAIGFLPVYSNFLTIRNGFAAYNCTTSGLKIGISGTDGVSTWSINGKVHIEGISTTMSGYTSNASGIGFFVANGSDGKCTGDVEIVNYQTGLVVGYENAGGGDTSFDGTVHVWTNSKGGYLIYGAILNSSDITFNKLTIDSPWAPEDTLCWGVQINAPACHIRKLTVEVNANTTPVYDDSVTAVQYNNSSYAPPGSYKTNRLGSRIDSIWTQSSSSSVRLKQVVDASLASNIDLDIGSINTDGNVYDPGWHTQSGRALLQKGASDVSFSTIITAIAQAPSSALWYPTEIPGRTIFWLDASNGYFHDADVNDNLRAWWSRLGATHAVQSGAAARPAVGATAWAGTNITSQQAIVFNGSTDFMLLDDAVDDGTDVRVFAALIPNSGGMTNFGPLFAFNNAAFGGILRQEGNGTAIAFTDQSGNGNSVDVTAGTPCLITGIWSSTSGEGTGSFGRVNGGSNCAAQALATGESPVALGGFMTSNTLSEAQAFTLAELIVVVDPMTLAEEQLYEGYLAWKWWNAVDGHSPILPDTHPYYNNAPPA